MVGRDEDVIQRGVFVVKDAQKITVRHAAQQIRIVGFVDFRRYLANLYKFIKARDDGYSYEKFSNDLGLGVSNASRQIIIGIRNMSTKHATDTAKKIGLRGSQATYFELMVAYANARETAERDELFLQIMHTKHKIEPRTLSAEQIRYYSSWLNPIIKELAVSPKFVGSVEWVQKSLRFPVRKNEVKDALDSLVALGFLLYDPDTETYVRRETDVPPLPIEDLCAVRYHQQMIECGKEAMTRIQSKYRNIAGCTALLSDESRAQVTQKINELIDLMAQLEADDREKHDTEIYQMNWQLFPFTETKE